MYHSSPCMTNMRLIRNSMLLKNISRSSTVRQCQPLLQGAYYTHIMDIHGRLLYTMVEIDEGEEVRSRRCLRMEGEKRERIHQDNIS